MLNKPCPPGSSPPTGDENSGLISLRGSPKFSCARWVLVVEFWLSAPSSPKANSSAASQRRWRVGCASATPAERLPGVGSLDKASTTPTERPLNADRASTERRPGVGQEPPATRWPLWRRLVFGVCGSLGACTPRRECWLVHASHPQIPFIFCL